MYTLIVSLILTQGGSVEGTVAVTVDGKPGPVKNALVFIKGYSTDAPKKGQSPELGQSGRAFEKVVLPVVNKSRVQFTNNEPEGIYHHVFTPESKTKFDAGKFKPGTPAFSPELTYEGPINVYCDIHKEMISTIYVVPNDRHTLLSTAEGSRAPFRIDGIRAGRWKIAAWHRTTGEAVEREVEIVEGKVAKIDLVLEGTSVATKAQKDRVRREGRDYPQKKPDGGAPGEDSKDIW